MRQRVERRAASMQLEKQVIGRGEGFMETNLNLASRAKDESKDVMQKADKDEEYIFYERLQQRTEGRRRTATFPTIKELI